ncbi:uncharacterized protein [Acropora muricata]|uniref:uncharacterized protein n=1 Tax=Acropora muricata TaxID=159855 RepID=UPI0034E474DE
MQSAMVFFMVFIVFSATKCASADSKVHLPYYQLFTPMKLMKAASFIHHHHSVTASQLTFLSAPENYARLLSVPMIPPKAINTDTNLVAKLVVGVNKAIGLGESDPSFVISDGQLFIGANLLDKNNYKNGAPCGGIEGSSGTVMRNRRYGSRSPKPPVTVYPGRVEIWLSLSDRWGTCFVSLDGGFSRETTYQNKLNPTNGLLFELYGDDKSERIGIKYIEVSIVQEN